MTESVTPTNQRQQSAWAVGYAMFASVLMMAGVFHFIAGLVAVAEEEFYVIGTKWVLPVWSIAMIFLAIAVIWALTVHGRDITG